ncbi:hypothetical protein PCANC_26292 [Puccinia coronata f. sp. avenae]|uniref:Uncharacterized protein n=1 Tax=Puccinia coronata f. sp. avenae TaxID=200324 RepID=A0A2N5S330_9BASI|nr:hypothetical protein PCANC_26292 [Puccinia coronata f. sp. avenae]
MMMLCSAVHQQSAFLSTDSSIISIDTGVHRHPSIYIPADRDSSAGHLHINQSPESLSLRLSSPGLFVPSRPAISELVRSPSHPWVLDTVHRPQASAPSFT